MPRKLEQVSGRPARATREALAVGLGAHESIRKNYENETYGVGRHRNMRIQMYVKGGAAHDPEHRVEWTWKGCERARTYRKDGLGLVAGKLLQHTLNRLRCRLVLELVQNGRRRIV